MCRHLHNAKKFSLVTHTEPTHKHNSFFFANLGRRKKQQFSFSLSMWNIFCVCFSACAKWDTVIQRTYAQMSKFNVYYVNYITLLYDNISCQFLPQSHICKHTRQRIRHITTVNIVSRCFHEFNSRRENNVVKS